MRARRPALFWRQFRACVSACARTCGCGCGRTPAELATRAHARTQTHARTHVAPVWRRGIASRCTHPRARTLSHARAHARGRRHGHGHVARVHKYADVNAKCWPHARQTHNHPSAKKAALSSHTATPATTHRSVPRILRCVGRWVCGTPYPSNPQVAIDFLGSDGHGARGAGQHLVPRRTRRSNPTWPGRPADTGTQTRATNNDTTPNNQSHQHSGPMPANRFACTHTHTEKRTPSHMRRHAHARTHTHCNTHKVARERMQTHLN